MRVTRHWHLSAFVCLAALLCLVELAVVRAAYAPRSADVVWLAITVDLSLGIPLLYYLLLVRTRRSAAISLAPVFLAALLIAHLILPAAQQRYLELIQAVLPLVEGAVLVYAVLKVREVSRHYRATRPTVVYASDALEAALRQSFGSGKLPGILATELSIVYYVVGGWFVRFKPANAADVAVSCYRRSGYGPVVGMFAGLIVLETGGLHLLVQHWSPTAAWILSGLSIYSLIWVVGDYQAVRLHPVVLGPRQLSLRTGLRWRVDVDWHNIASVQRAAAAKQPPKGFLNMAVYGEPRWMLHLEQPVVAAGLFGTQRRVHSIGLTVDDERLFEQELRKRLKTEAA